MGKRIPPWAFDLALAGLLFVVSAFELAVLRPEGWRLGIVINAGGLRAAVRASARAPGHRYGGPASCC